MKLTIGKRSKNIVKESNAIVNAFDKGNSINTVADAERYNVEIEADVEGVIGKFIDNQNQPIDGKIRAQILQEEKRKNIVTSCEEKRKTAEQEHQHEMEKRRFEKEKQADRKNIYQVWQEEKRKSIALTEEENRKATELQNQLILEQAKMEVEKEQLATERERLAFEKEKILLAKGKQKTKRTLIVTVGALIAILIVVLFL